MKKTHPLNLWLLKQYCKKYGIDIQEIDETLSYYEVKEHLISLVKATLIPSEVAYGPLRTDPGGLIKWKEREEEWAAQMAQHIQEHFLENYIAHVEAGWTISEEVGEPYYGPGLFSLSLHVQRAVNNG